MCRILVVDDDPHICLAIWAWLKRYDFRVSIADGGVNGLAALENGTFDLMIVDIFMPNMHGFESIGRFHERAATVPLIAVSGSAFSASDAASPDFLRIAVRLGATRCLRRPFKPTTWLGVNRRVPVRGRAASNICCRADRRRGRAVGTAGRNQFAERVAREKTLAV